MKKVFSIIGKPFSFIWKGLSTRIWFFVTIVTLIITITVTLIVTQVPFISNTLTSVFGGETYELVKGDPSKYQYYKSDYSSKSEVLEAANNFNEKIADEGMILLKNNGALPIKTPDSSSDVTVNPKVSIFGKNSVNLVYGGSGSSQADSSKSLKLDQALMNAGYDVNPVLTEFYNSSKSGSGRPQSPSMGSILTGFPTGETAMDLYTSQVKESYNQYNDAAFIVISRIGGEGYDLPRSMFYDGSSYTNWKADASKRIPVPGASSVDDHYLELDANEKALINEVTEKFDKVIILVNASQTMELSFIEQNEKIDAAVWIGGPGGSGLNALGRILNGSVNPSGRTTDTFAVDFTKDPSWNNFGNNISNGGNQYYINNGKKDILQSKYYVDYEEGIYVGYKYYETRYETEGSNGDEWYKENVVYPLGYGLSYSSYSYELVNKSELSSTNLSLDTVLNVKVKVTNTGSVSGKETVQVYATLPYYNGGIEKASKNLVGFAKTKLLNPGEFDTVTIEIPAYYLASYDYNDANSNGFKGYEIENGEYVLSISKNAHVAEETVAFEVNNPLRYTTDLTTGNTVENRFDDVSSKITTYLSRANWDNTWPTVPTSSERLVTKEFINSMKYTTDDEGKPWQTDVMPTQNSHKKSYVQLYEMINVDYDDAKWDEFMNQLSVSEMANLVGTGIYQTSAINCIGKQRTISVDGPVGITAFMGDPAVYDTASYACGVMIAATYNVEIAEEFGTMVANEAIIGNEKGDGSTYCSWYAPGVNIHRSPFGGRNWEYYSEDATLTGIIGSMVIKGAREKGLITHVKHFALNDQETNRCDGVSVWANEQAIREIYLRSFELCIKDGQSLGVMSSFNSLGTTWTGGDYRLLTEILRNEWGFKGSVITDFNLYSHMPADQMVRAGGDLNLSQEKMPTINNDPTQVTVIRQAAKNILYSISRSMAMNGLGDGVKYATVMAPWQRFALTIDLAIVISLAIYGTLVIVISKKRRNKTISK